MLTRTACSSQFVCERRMLSMPGWRLILALALCAGRKIDKANAWWWAVLCRVQKACEPDTARVRAIRAEKARLAAEEARSKAEEAAEAERVRVLDEEEAAGPPSSGGTDGPSDAGPSDGSPSKERGKKKGSGDKSSPGKGKGKGTGKGKGKGKGSPSKKQGKGKGKRIPDEWDSDDSEFEDLEEEVSEEEDEPEPEEESLDEQYVRFFKQQLEAATDAYNTTSVANGLGIRDRFHTVAQLQELLRRHFQRLDSCDTTACCPELPYDLFAGGVGIARPYARAEVMLALS